MNTARLIMAVVIGSPLMLALFLIWIPVAMAAKIANGLLDIVDAADELVCKYFIDPFIYNKK